MIRRILAASLLLFLSGALWAQTETATVSGRITDPTGAVVTDADVQATNIDTNVSVGTRTNAGGLYVLPNLAPGIYRLTVTASGFKQIVKTGFTLHVQDTISQNFAMEVGTTSETVTVTGDAPQVNTDSAAVGTVVDRHFVENMPLNGRTFQSLIQLTPGVVAVASSFANTGQFSINGQRADANYFTVDGVSANFGVSSGVGLAQSVAGTAPALAANGGTNGLVSVDAMQEFRVQTSTFAPEYGRTPGGQVSIVTRSGTNNFHGSVSDYLRNSVFDANDWFANFNHLPKPKSRQNDISATLGGPIWRNKTFFFASYEGLHLKVPATATAIVPTVSARKAVVSAMLPFVNVWPLPNGTDFGNGTAQFNATFANPSDLDSGSIRLDHVLNSHITLFGRYSIAPSRVVARQIPQNNIATNETDARMLTIGSTQLLGSRLTNEVRANWSSTVGNNFQELDSYGGGVPITAAAFLPASIPANSKTLLLLTASGVGFYTLGTNVANEGHQFNFTDNASLAIGNHRLKVGVDYRRLTPVSNPRNYSQTVSFTGLTGATSLTSGIASSVSVSAFKRVTIKTQNYSFYAQDAWHVVPRLTLTYGLRWDINPAMQAEGDQPLLALQNVSDPAKISIAASGTPIYQTVWTNLAPRLGLAYQLFTTHGQETVIRAGAGVFYDLGAGVIESSARYPFTASKSVTRVPFPLAGTNGDPAVVSLNPPYPSAISGSDPNILLPRTYQWNVAIEQSLGTAQSFSLTYVGSGGRKLLRLNQYTRPNANFLSSVLFDTNASSSNYDGLQAQFKRQMSHGLQILASYTWSHSIDDISSDAAAATLGTPKLDRGNSDFDIRHSGSVALSYAIPRPRWNPFVDAVLRDWSVDTLFLGRTAPPIDLVGATATGILSGNLRPDYVPGRPLYIDDAASPGGRKFNKAAFLAPPVTRQGTFSRNVVRGFPGWQQDFALRRKIRFDERWDVQFGWEVFNVFNHANFGAPVNFLVLPTFGTTTQTLASYLGGGANAAALSSIYQFGGPRSMQFSLRVSF